MVIMASGIVHGRVHTTVMATTTRNMVIIKLKKESQTINRKPQRKVTKLKSNLFLFLG